jgi:hypothetical protein
MNMFVYHKLRDMGDVSNFVSMVELAVSSWALG